MLFSDLSFDLSPLLQFVLTALVVALGLLQIIKATASRYLVVDARFEGDDGQADVTVDRRPVSSSGVQMSGGGGAALCFVCGDYGKKICTGCRAVRYCSPACQSKHWREDHKLKCRDLKFSDSVDSKSSPAGANLRRKASGQVDKFSSEVSLIPARGTCKVLQRAKKVLFPYDEFVKLFNWDNPGFPPCGLLNCGNSCFANVVLQCLACTRPLVAYLLEKGHSQKCNRNDWCFLCELESHVHRVNQSLHPFSPINILSRLPHIGGNLGYGKQEDAHEFMRFAIDTMQSVFLDEFGGESALDHATQQTTLIQHMFGGHLQSEVICTKCDNVSYCYENMMDLTVEIQGDAASLENCLDQFTKKEWLDGENMYKCDRCNAYVKAWKRLTVHQAPNILTVALKRFQSGRFGKLNKRVTFPETLDLRPYMSGSGDGTDLYRLYAVVVHVDMLNASFFGHYICYTQDFCGNWYRIDDCKVMKVELEEVLGQGAYMLLYSRLNVRQPRVKPLGPATEEKEQPTVEVTQEVCQGSRDSVQEYCNVQSGSSVTISRCLSSDFRLQSSEQQVDVDSVHPINVGSDPIRENLEDMELGNYQSIPLGPADPDGACLSCQPHEAEENSSSELMHEESSSGLSNKQSSTAGSNAVESQEPSTSSAADCHHEEENYTSEQSKELPPPESQSSRSFCSNMLETVSSGVSNTGLQNVLETVEVANTGLEPSLVTDNSSVLITGTTSLGKAFQATENVLEVKSSLLLGDKANSNCKSKPLFRPGFLDRPVGRKSLSKDEKTQHEPAAVCTSKSNYNGFADHAHQNGSKSNGHDDVGLETFHGNSKGILVSEGPVTSSSAIDKLSRKIHWAESRELNGGTSMVGSACNTDCNGTSNVGSIHIRDVRLETLCENGKDISLDFRNDLNSDEELDKRSEFRSGKLEASCNGFADTIIFNQNESNICGKDEKSVKICENGNGVALVPRLPHVPLGPEVAQEEFDRAGTDPLKPKTDCGGYTDSFYSTGETEICSQGVAPGASWENDKDVHLNCKRPRQEDV